MYILGYMKDLLHILGPVRGLAQGHEPTVGQDSEHDNHAEQCEVSCQGNRPRLADSTLLTRDTDVEQFTQLVSLCHLQDANRTWTQGTEFFRLVNVEHCALFE